MTFAFAMISLVIGLMSAGAEGGRRLQENVAKRSAYSLCLLLTIFLAGFGGKASANPSRIVPADIPQLARKAADFVPPGWRIESTLVGDLNADNIADTVLELIEDKPATVDGEPNERNRALLILLNRKSGELQRIAVATRLLRCTTCFGSLAGPEGGSAGIRIVKGVVTIEELWGSRESVLTVLRFRYKPSSNRVVLIGQDIQRSDRATGAELRESSNFLTGIKIKEGARYDEKQERLVKIPVQKETISINPSYIEDIDYRSFER